ncbi:hypothetical protein BM1_03214 [Bipolaris maydis]|nr:hypothetical protein BM1_03214 [Bipolaris maydis]
MSHPQPKLEALFNELPSWPHRHRLVVFEYQKNYRGVEKLKDEWLKNRIREQAQPAPPGRPPLEAAKVRVKDCIADILCTDEEADPIAQRERMSRGAVKKTIVNNHSVTYGQGLVLERDQASRTFSGHCYGFTMGDANHGSLKEQNSIWEYDENSKFEATGFTHLGYPEVLDSAHQVVNSQGPYHLRSNNCEIFCEKLSKVISVESWYEYFQGVKRRSQIRWNDPPEPQPDVYSGFGQEPEVIPADLLNHSDIGQGDSAMKHSKHSNYSNSCQAYPPTVTATVA